MNFFFNIMICIFLCIDIVLSLNNSWAAVIIDTRFDAAVVASIANARHHIPRYVKIYILTDSTNWLEVANVFDDVPNLAVVEYDLKSATQSEYNELLLSKRFWNLFNEQYILIFHRDSRFCSYSHQHIDRYVGHFDFIGAPWSSQTNYGVQVGNGGFSLRCRASMLRCAESELLEPAFNEDASMTTCLKRLNLRLPSVEVASEFAVETVRYSSKIPLAIHKAWDYMGRDLELARYCPESAII